MSVLKILKEHKEKIHPDEQEVKVLRKVSRSFIAQLKCDLRDAGHSAQVAMGGSFAKGTLVKKESHDVDILVRFDWKYDAISDMLEKVLVKTAMRNALRIERIHGSRDYFRLHIPNSANYLELIPVTKIKHVHQERNVTDLSYFHVSYVKKRISGLEDEVRLAKSFMQAQRVYGAESYIKGFSGYAVECLIIYYKSFLNMLKALSKVPLGERAVIDIEKFYKKREVFLEMNENRLHSPIVLVDPTYKERNALAALGHDTFARFQERARAFLKKPSAKFFELEPINPDALQKMAKQKKSEYMTVHLVTDRQPGDIAGTKLRKFADFLSSELMSYFTILHKDFEYDGAHTATLHLVARPKEKVVRIGPPDDGSKRMKKHAKIFLAKHPNAYLKNKLWHADIKVEKTLREFLTRWKKEYGGRYTEMGITQMSV